jgi:hypothetical protein
LAPVVGAALAAAAFGLTLLYTWQSVERMPRALVPGTATVTLDDGTNLVYAEVGIPFAGALHEPDEVDLTCTFIERDGTRRDARRPSFGAEYEFGDRIGVAQLAVELVTPGDYQLTCQNASNEQVVVAVGGDFTNAIVVGGCASHGSLWGGILVAIVVFFRRRSARKRAAIGA